MANFKEEFKAFLSRGSVMDMAVGVIIGAAFGAIVNSLVEDIFMPVVALVLGTFDFSDLAVPLPSGATLNYGNFIMQVVNFLIIAFCIFWFVKAFNKISHKREAAPAAPKRLCPYCYGELDDKASRCPHCTSDVADSITA